MMNAGSLNAKVMLPNITRRAKVIKCDFSYFPVEILVNRICNKVAAIIE